MNAIDVATWVLAFVKSWGPAAGVVVFFWKGAAWFHRYEETTKKLETVNANMTRITGFVEQADKKIETVTNAAAEHRRIYERDRQEHREEHAGINSTLRDLIRTAGEHRGKLDSIHD